MRFYLKVGMGLLVVGTLGATPAWLIDRWVIPLSPLLYLVLAVGGIVAVLTLTGFDQQVRRWKEERGPIRH